MILPIEHLEISTFQRLASVLWLKQRTEEKVVLCKKRLDPWGRNQFRTKISFFDRKQHLLSQPKYFKI